MVILGLFIIVSFTSLGVSGHGTKFCYSCDDQVNLAACSQVEKCHGEGNCGAEIYHHNGINMFRLGCFEHKDCEHTHPLVGKRAGHDPIVCRECCAGELCNNKLCGRYAPTTTAATTTTTKAALTTTVPLPACRDHEEDGVTCASIDHDEFCTSDLSFIVDIKVQKCPAYCGMCDSNGNFLPSSTAAGLTATTVAITPKPDTAAPVVATAGPMVSDMPTDGPTDMPTNMTTDGPTDMPTDMPTDGPTTALPCVDDETGGFSCAAFDTLNFCTDTSSVAYPLAIEKCPAHCGFCSTSGGD